MPNQKVPQLPILSAVTGDDLFYVVDVSDTTDDPTGSSKGITRDDILKNITGLTATTISATTYQNLPTDVFVTGGTYTSGNAIFTNNTGGTFTVSGFTVGGGGGQVFYLNLSQSQNGNRLLSTTASTASEQTSGVTIANGVTGTIASFQSQPLNITLLPGGIWSFYLHSYKEDSNASFNIFVEVYKRTSGGTETLLFATDPAPVTTNSPNPSMQLSDGYFSGTSLNVSDSVVAVVRATNTDNQSHIITFFTEGSTHYSYVVSTIPTQQGLTCDTLSGCSIIQTIQTDISNKFDKSGGTVNGNLTVTGNTSLQGVTATTISATTISGTTFYGNGTNLTGVVKGSGTANYIPKWTGTTGIGNSQIQDDGTSVGINTTPTAAYKLKVYAGGVTAIHGETIGGTNDYGVYGLNIGDGPSQTYVGILGYGAAADTPYVDSIYVGGRFLADGSNNNLNYGGWFQDGTEGLNKVLISATADGKSNWSSNLTGLTSVSATTISGGTMVITTTPTTDNTLTQVLSRDPVTGTVKLVDTTSFPFNYGLANAIMTGNFLT